MSVSEELTAEIENAVKESMDETLSDQDIEEHNREESLEENKGEGVGEPEGAGETGDEEGGSEIGEDVNSGDDSKEQKGEESESYYQEEISDRTLERAINLGFSPDDIAEFATEKDLISACILSENLRKPDKEEKKEEKSPTLEEIYGEVDWEDSDPKVKSLLESMLEQIKSQNAEINALKGTQEQYNQATAAANAKEIENWFDSQVESLGEDYESILGKGTYSSLNQQSPQFQKREAIADQMSILLAGYHASGKTPPPRDSIFNTAVSIVLSKEVNEIEQGKVRSELQKRSKNHISRASKRKAKTTSEEPDDEIAKLIDEKFFNK